MSSEPTVSELQAIITELEKGTTVLLRRDLELKRAQAELEQVDVRKSEFVSIAAHQLRTPLSAINWSLQFLLDAEAGPLNEEQHIVVTQAQKSIFKMVNLVNDLLNADHLEYDKVLFERTVVNLDKLVPDIVQELKPLADERNITISTDLNTQHYNCHCDTKRIKEALLNMLSNAIKYSYPASNVTIRTKFVSDKIQISIRDTGIGIPDKYKTHIFQKFTRADNAQNVDPNGSGLGMFIAKKIVDAHNGTISFTSVPDKETVFTIELPIT